MYQAKSGVKNFFPLLGGGGGLSLDKNSFPSLNMYQAKSGVKNFFPFLGGRGGSLDKKFFPQSEHVSSQILVSKIFPFSETPPPPQNLRPGTPPKNLRPGTPPKSETWGPPKI